jgi:preprotein translocase subunit SecG
MQSVVIVVHLMIVLTMIAFVLLQRSEGGGLGMGSSGGSGFMSSRGTANALTRVTAFLAMAFFATSLLLSIIAGFERKPRSILDGTSPASTPTTPGAPIAPGGLLDQLRGPPGGTQGQGGVPGGVPGGAPGGTPSAPAPSGPQVPSSQ